MTNTNIQGCKQASCNIAGDGKCIENLPLEQCPYIIRLKTIDFDVEDNDTIEDNRTKSSGRGADFDLYSGDELTAYSAHSILRASLTRVIALAGGRECGKTSLLTCIYDEFQKGEFGGYLFAGSKTFVGYEQRCFDSRVASGRIEPTTERTPNVDEFRFLHLAVRRSTLDTPIQHLLLSDITGEAFKAARHSSLGVNNLSIFKRADHFVLIIDGESIASPELRHKEAYNIKTLIRSLIEGNVLNSRSFVNILLSKWDLVLSAGDATQAQSFTDNLLQDIQKKYSKSFSNLKCHLTAAQPKSLHVPIGYGVEELLQSWVETSPLLTQPMRQLDEEPHPSTVRRFLSFSV